MTKKRKTVKAPSIPTPGWATTSAMMLENFITASEDGKELIRKEFARMARAADAYNDLHS